MPQTPKPSVCTGGFGVCILITIFYKSVIPVKGYPCNHQKPEDSMTIQLK